MELKKVKKYKLIYSVNLAEINFYAWMIVRNLHNYVLKEIINHKENKYTTKKTKQKKECEALKNEKKLMKNERYTLC